jgi:hypothetical protein
MYTRGPNLELIQIETVPLDRDIVDCPVRDTLQIQRDDDPDICGDLHEYDARAAEPEEASAPGADGPKEATPFD